MSEPLPVIVAPPSDTGGRRVRVHGENLGLAYNLEDLSNSCVARVSMWTP